MVSFSGMNFWLKDYVENEGLDYINAYFFDYLEIWA